MKFRKFSKTHSCPSCASTEIYRLKRSGITNRIVCQFSDYRPHWCSNCDTFFYAPRRPRTVRMQGLYGVSRRPQGPKPPQQPHAGGLTH